MKQAVLVLGMHRSGTSAIAGACHLLGVAAPATALGPAFDNPTGFWESEAISVINETILGTPGCTWYDCLPFNPARLDATVRHDLLTHATATLAQEFGDAPLFVMKDPRFSLVLELWQPIFTALNVAVAPVVALRHPTEVVASLRRRDGMHAEVAAPLWLHYTLEAEHLTRNRRRAVLSYDSFLQDWRGSMARVAAAAAIAWPVAFDSAAPAVEGFLRPQLRHHYAAPRKVAVGKPPISDWIAETYDALRRIEAGEGDTQFARLDRTRAQFAAWRASAPRVGAAAAAGQEPLSGSASPPNSASPAISPSGRTG